MAASAALSWPPHAAKEPNREQRIALTGTVLRGHESLKF